MSYLLENKKRSFALSLVVLASILAMSGCSGVQSEAKYPTVSRDDLSNPNDIHGKQASIFGKNGMHLFGKDKDSDSQTGIGVNSFLWRASLDTVAFMPLASADPFGGVILTDWYAPP